MFERFKKKAETSPLALFEYKDLSGIKALLSQCPEVSKVLIKDENTIEVFLAQDKKLKCMLKVFEGGKAVFVTYWELNKKNRLAYSVGSKLWNDQKELSHYSCSYLTQNDVCVFESHINLEWGIPQAYFERWSSNYLSLLPDYVNHISKVKEVIKRLPKSDLTALEKLELVGGVSDILSSVAVFFGD